MNNQPKTEPTLSLHFVEILDSVANIAKATGNYGVFVNSLLTVTAIVLGELTDAQQAQQTLVLLGQRQEAYREQNRINAAAAVTANQPTGVQ